MFHTSVCNTASDPRFAFLGHPQRVWAVSAVHGESKKLVALHDRLLPLLQPGDRVIYLGNYTGYGTDPCGTVDEMLTFRRMAMSIPGMMAHDIVYLRGGQEEMWQKLLQVQFACNPQSVLEWMFSNGVAQTLAAYGQNPADGLRAAQEGVMSLTRWTNRLRDSIRRRKGHEIFSTQHRRAAFTNESNEFPMLFVHAGIDARRPLGDQGDNFWWSGAQFNAINIPYDPFLKVVRGFDPAHNGLYMNCVTATLDGGCGFGGSLVCAGFDQGGNVFELIEA